MRISRKTLFAPVVALLLGLCSPASLMAQPAAPAGMAGMSQGPLPVGVITLEESDVPYQSTLPGRAVAFEEVDIRPRVNGVISEIAYTPGRPVNVGDLLFRIENETYEAAVQSAEADLASAEATLEGAKLTLERYRKIEGTGISKGDVQDAEVAYQKAEAALKTAQASLKTAQLSLGWTELKSPIAGIPDVADVSVGSVVTSNQTTALTTVTRLNPIYVDVEEASVRMLKNRSLIERGLLKMDDKMTLSLLLENGEMFDGKGKLSAPGTSVSKTTGTVALRLEFENPQRKIIPGQFLRVDVTLGTSKAILVPQGATQRSNDGSLMAYVVKDGKVATASLEEIGSLDNSWIVTGGVSVGDQVIVDNIRNLKEGIEVKTIPVTYVDGLIKETTSDNAAGSGGSDATQTATKE